MMEGTFDSQLKRNDQDAEILQRQMNMYGGFKQEILQEFDDALGEPKMKVMSILSDVQEETAMGNVERARQLTNVAKMLMMERL